MNGIDPYHDIAGLKVNDTKVTNVADSEFLIDEIEKSSETNNLTIIG